MSEKWDDDQAPGQNAAGQNGSDHEQNVTEDQEKYAFLQETFKDEQINIKTVGKKLWKTAGRGMIFGFAACLVFCAFKPWMETFFSGPSTKITIPEDEDDRQSSVAEDEGEEANLPDLTVENYKELNEAIYQVALRAGKCVVEVYDDNQSELKNTEFDNKDSVSGLIVWNEDSDILIWHHRGSSKKEADWRQYL